MIYIATYIDVQPDSTEDAITLLTQYHSDSKAERGNLWIHGLQENSRQNRFVVLEAWSDEESLQAHESAEHTTQFRSRLRTIHNSPYDRRVHTAFAVGIEQALAGKDALQVVTHVDVPPPRKDETEMLLRSLAEESRHDHGNLRYDVFQQLAPRTNHFTIFAIWRDQHSFVLHEAKPHTRQFREGLGAMLGAPYDERLYRFI